MLNMPLAIAHAQIRHRRYSPKPHAFESSLSYLWFDPDQLPEITKKSWLWSTGHWNILNLATTDFLKHYHGTIREKASKALLQYANTVLLPAWNIRVLALPRSLGFNFNSVIFYFILDQHQQPVFILSEVSNTPWNEQHVYVHDCRVNCKPHADYQRFEFNFEKLFHVSPFMPMDIEYRWQFNLSDQQNIIHMQLYRQQKLIFDVSMLFQLDAITFPSQQHRYAVYHVFEPIKMLASIYIQAFKLWRKKVPFYRHPQINKDR